jgi:hypothetical protein
MHGGERVVHGGQHAAVCLGERHEVRVGNLPVADHASLGYVDVRGLVGPELMSGQGDDSTE